MRKTILSLIITLVGVLAYGQDSYQLRWTGGMKLLGAVPSENQVKDNTGEPCAMLVVNVPLDDVHFRGDFIKGEPIKDGDTWYVFVCTLSADKTIEVQADRYYPVEVRLATDDGKRLTGNYAYGVDIELPSDENAQRAWLTVESKEHPNFSLAVDDDSDNVIESKDGKAMVNLFYGDHFFVVNCSDGYTVRRNFTLVGPPLTVNIDQQSQRRGYGTIMVDYKPVGSIVTIDGKVVGKSPGVFNHQTVGVHNVEVSFSGYEPFSQTCDVVKNQTAVISGELHK